MSASNRASTGTSTPQGAYNIKGMYKNAIAAGFEPKFPVSLETLDKGRQGLDYLDLARDYNDHIVERPSDELTSAMLNARNSTHLTVICPIMFTEEYNFTMRSADVLQIPFDQVGPGATARVTTYNMTERFASLNMFKRAIRLEMTKLQDERFGPPAFTQALVSLRTQAEMTLSGMVSYAIIDFPYMNRMNRLQHPTRAFSHQREMLMSEEETAWLNHVDGVGLLQKMIGKRNGYNKIDMAVVPGGAMTLVAATVGESRPMPAYQFILDSDLRRYLLLAYDGNKSLTSIPLGDGTTFHIAENFAQRISTQDGEEEEMQALRTEITLGEAGLMATRPSNAPYPVKPNLLDIGLADHQENDVSPKRISFGEMMANCIIWYNRDGSKGDYTSPEKTDWGKDLLDAYNAMKGDVKRYFRDGNFDDNDHVPSEYLRQNLPIDQMYGFRHFFGFLSIGGDGDKIKFPERIGDLEQKTFPAMHAVRGASMLERYGKFDAMPDASDDEKTRKLQKLHAFATRYFPDADVPDTFAKFAKEYEGVLLASKVAAAGAYAAPDGPAFEGAREKYGTSSSFKINTASRLVPRESETFAAYDARLSHDALIDGVRTGEIADGWAALLSHTADHALSPVKQLFYEAHKAPAVTPAETQALQTFTETMASYSLRPHTKDIAERAVTMMRSGGNSLEAIVPRDNASYLTTVGEARLNNAQAPSTLLATGVRNALGIDAGDAMDIDETPRGTSMFFPQHTAAVPSGGSGTSSPESFAETPAYSNSFSWNRFEEHLQYCDTDVQKFLYCMIVRAKFTRKTCVALASAGFEVFRIVALKFNIHFLVDSIALLHAGYETMQMAFGHVIVLTGVDADAGYLTVTAQFHAGVICWKPEYMDFIPFAIGNRIRGGRNNNAVTSVMDMFATNAGRPSVVYVPTPVTETKYHFPLSLNNDPVYGAPNTEGVNAYHKGSWRDLLNVYAGDFHEGLVQPSQFRTNSSFYETSLIATNLHRACTWYYGDSDTMRPVPGTGQLGPIGRNVSGAHRAFNGIGNFPTNFETSMVF